MFDDVKKSNPSNDNQPPKASDQLSSPSSGKKNLDDMFGDVDPAPEAVAPAQVNLEKPSAVQSGKIRPLTGSVPLAPPINPNAVNPNQLLVEEGKTSGIKKSMAALVGVILLGGAGYAAYYLITNNQTVEQNPLTNDTADTGNMPADNIPEDNTTTTEENLPDNNLNTQDDDSDGLTNEEELRLGTAIDNVDSDDDGLFDREEVRIYRTDPLNPDSDNDGLFDREEIFVWNTKALVPDTDNDGFLDGVEVAQGYDPNGLGKLPEQPAE